MTRGPQHWALILTLMVFLGMTILGVPAGNGASAESTAAATLVVSDEACCGHDTAAHLAECLPICGTSQAILSGALELDLRRFSDLRVKTDGGAETRFADLEPRPPQRSSGSI